MSWYQFVYRACYALGFTPWDRPVPAPGLTALLEGPDAPPPGCALDIGCGTGTNSVYLAQHGWQVTGVDMVLRALAAARRRAEEAGIVATFIQGDVTRLRELGVGDGYNLIVDVGCFHTLPSDMRDAYVDGVSAVAAPGATLLLFGFSRGKLTPMKAGIAQDEVRNRFSGWDVLAVEQVADEVLRREKDRGRFVRRAIRYFSPWQYRLVRAAPV